VLDGILDSLLFEEVIMKQASTLYPTSLRRTLIHSVVYSTDYIDKCQLDPRLNKTAMRATWPTSPSAERNDYGNQEIFYEGNLDA